MSINRVGVTGLYVPRPETAGGVTVSVPAAYWWLSALTLMFQWPAGAVRRSTVAFRVRASSETETVLAVSGAGPPVRSTVVLVPSAVP